MTNKKEHRLTVVRDESNDILYNKSEHVTPPDKRDRDTINYQNAVYKKHLSDEANNNVRDISDVKYKYKDTDTGYLSGIDTPEHKAMKENDFGQVGYQTNPMYEKLLKFRQVQEKKRFTVEDLLKW